ncbi:hypothetical protein PtA15_6A839 [Puccinia triticina]|uniref:Uncharacterized protein n=1 Tax=Puccinia triticina TaxID=208348 RepID=A0ABY7CQE4_9BASI|nr:uncharacterized protein PtA15_6A839 [Puccinia triticina]WAQ86207.1 hypothetical protein PtA15_6A839 [Puccinia triticina]
MSCFEDKKLKNSRAQILKADVAGFAKLDVAGESAVSLSEAAAFIVFLGHPQGKLRRQIYPERGGAAETAPPLPRAVTRLRRPMDTRIMDYAQRTCTAADLWVAQEDYKGSSFREADGAFSSDI